MLFTLYGVFIYFFYKKLFSFIHITKRRIKKAKINNNEYMIKRKIEIAQENVSGLQQRILFTHRFDSRKSRFAGFIMDHYSLCPALKRNRERRFGVTGNLKRHHLGFLVSLRRRYIH